jgi:predicted nucleotidyltransferase
MEYRKNIPTICGWDSCPEPVRELVNSIVEKYREILGENLVGFYLHGSLAMGCFNSQRSDIDFLVAAKKPLTVDCKKRIIQFLLDIRDKAPAKGIEMSIILEQTLREFIYPTPYELHYSLGWNERFRKDEVDYTEKRFDTDLAAHCVITRERGICLYGKPVGDMFPEIPEEYYRQSLLEDARSILEKPRENPVYTVLNLCRILAYVKDGIITSKAEGGQWGLDNLPGRYSSLISQVMDVYSRNRNEEDLDTAPLDGFIRYMKIELPLS